MGLKAIPPQLMVVEALARSLAGRLLIEWSRPLPDHFAVQDKAKQKDDKKDSDKKDKEKEKEKEKGKKDKPKEKEKPKDKADDKDGQKDKDKDNRDIIVSTSFFVVLVRSAIRST